MSLDGVVMWGHRSNCDVIDGLEVRDRKISEKLGWNVEQLFMVEVADSVDDGLWWVLDGGF